MFPVKIITRINRRSHDFTGNYANAFPNFFFNRENEANRRREGIIIRAGVNHDGCRQFIPHVEDSFNSGNIRDFRRRCDQGTERAVIVQPGHIRRRVGKERRRRKEWIGQWDTPPGVSHLAGKLPRCSTKSRGNLGDYAAHRSSRVRSPSISCFRCISAFRR